MQTTRADLPDSLALEAVDVVWPSSDIVERFAPESDIPELVSRVTALVEEDGGISCSSRDKTKDCFCPGGCWRTETDCGCLAVE